MVIVGRAPELAEIAAVLEAARHGAGASLCLVGEPGIGKTTLLDAAARSAAGFLVLRATGVPAELSLGHGALLALLLPVRDRLDAVPGPQRDALAAAVGWAGPGGHGDRFLVAAGALSLLAAAAERQPLLVAVDDAQWIDRESSAVLAFVARRLGHDPVALLVAARPEPDSAAVVDGMRSLALAGLPVADAAELLRGQVGAGLVDPLVVATGGNPLALIEAVRRLTPEQRRGSAPLPDVLPLGDRLASAFRRPGDALPACAHRALVLAATSGEPDAGPVVAALRAEGHDPQAALAAAERAGVVALDAGRLTFTHPLLRSAVWSTTPAAERRSAHAALAAALAGDPDRQTRHLAEATVGYDAGLAARLEALAGRERTRRGYAAASVVAERAAGLHPDPVRTASARAAAAEDALLGGDPNRVRKLAGQVLAGPADGPTRARALLALGTLEHYAGAPTLARPLLTEAAGLGTGAVRLRALAELSIVGYRLGSAEAMAAAADALAADVDSTDPEHAMLAHYTRAAALAFSGDWVAARVAGLRAVDLLEGEPSLRDEPRHLVTAVLAPAWAGEPELVRGYLDRRMDAARALGALGMLPLALSLIAGGAMALGEHQLAYAWAGEAVELGIELGYVADLAYSYEVLAFEQAARGLHADAAAGLAEARRLADRADISAGAVHGHLVAAFAALCRGDLDAVVRVLEWRVAVDGGRLPRGDYPLGVAPELVEAYLGLGRRDDAVALAGRHAEANRDSPVPEIRAHVARLDGVLAADDAAAEAAFEAAYGLHSDPFGAARTRLLHGARLRRAGWRVAAREQLRAAAAGFDALGLDGWTARAIAELAATGQRPRRSPRDGDQLTSQETRVALLVARGLSNRDIAAALFVSPRTVEHHVSSVLRKRGMRSRTELAGAFGDGGGSRAR